MFSMVFIYSLFGLLSLVSIEAVHLSSCATWNSTGVTVLGTNSPGNSSNELNLPDGIFLQRETNTLYVADTGNRRIQSLLLSQSTGTGVTVVSNIDSASALYVDKEGVNFYVALKYFDRVEKWTRNGKSGLQIGSQCKQCAGVWVDAEQNVYMTESGTHRVLKWSSKTNRTVTVAGQADEEGQSADLLYFPTGIYVSSTDNTLYIADTLNNRVQKWNNGVKQGITVAGCQNGTSGYNGSFLSSPLDVWVDDQSNVVFVADSDNNRIQKWLPNQSSGTTIAGSGASGSASDQLSSPTSIAFDSQGNLYVCDRKNHRIQKFALTSNQSCSNVIHHKYFRF